MARNMIQPEQLDAWLLQNTGLAGRDKLAHKPTHYARKPLEDFFGAFVNAYHILMQHLELANSSYVQFQQKDEIVAACKNIHTNVAKMQQCVESLFLTREDSSSCKKKIDDALSELWTDYGPLHVAIEREVISPQATGRRFVRIYEALAHALDEGKKHSYQHAKNLFIDMRKRV